MANYAANMNLEVSLVITADTYEDARAVRIALRDFLAAAPAHITGLCSIDVDCLYEGQEEV